VEQGTEWGTHATTRKIARVAEDSGGTLTLDTLLGRSSSVREAVGGRLALNACIRVYLDGDGRRSIR
jgi:hypothetical protein